MSEVLKDNRSDSDALCLFALTELRVAKSMASVTREKNEHTEVFLKRLIDSRTIDDLLPIQLFDRAIDADSNNATAYCGRGLAKDLAGKSGMDDYDQAIRLAPNMADAYLLRAMSKANTQSLADLNKANELEPSNPIILCHRAIRLIDVDNQKAVADLVELTRLMPNYLPTYEMLASVYFKLGDPVNALKYAGIGQEISRALEHQK